MEIKIGCKYRVKTVEEMSADFPIYEDGSVNTPATFVSDMRKYCGSILTIVGMDYRFYRADIDHGCYAWGSDMLLPLEDSIQYYL